MSNCKYSEIFFSFNGEGKIPHGVGSLFVRTVGCNFTCRGFSNPTNAEIEWGFNPTNYETLDDLPVIKMGCDSAYSWHKDFKHLWKTATVKELATEILNTLPLSFNGSFSHPHTNQDIILTFTGGEPTSRLKFIVELLESSYLTGLKRVLFETNASIPLTDSLIQRLNNIIVDRSIDVIFANSPKLSISGEPRHIAIQPSVVIQQQSIYHVQTYFKFVSDDSDASFDEIDNVVKEYIDNGVVILPDDVLIMPVGATLTQQDDIDEKVAMKALDRGYIFSPRSHVAVFGNRMGT